jgi:hypothetical protein
MTGPGLLVFTGAPSRCVENKDSRLVYSSLLWFMRNNSATNSTADRAVRLIALWAALHDTIIGALEDGLGQR